MSVLAVESLPTDPLAALRELTASEAHLDRIRLDRIAAAVAGGASWDEVGDALGVSGQDALERYRADVGRWLEVNASRNSEVSDDDAMEIAVAEVRAVRREFHIS